ncbi:Sec-independent protein translocase subunit TatA/TatB [Desulfotalea psychrophila]|uniref:Sec-independent protein translocase protein TatA n=1 Tax=Desulfotalea psychrophila (strain LSv54 / DSM 12343) TaxID=177439 RepID=Q6AJX6_DESPS|nr:twin-arginine translocase TatA/TatE family subunit [Desulfotalea psychrophila]CAG37350.1 related to Sec-independent protein translocase protein TatA [Desulfotalea psychrophila LSv54]
MFGLGAPELIVILVIVILIFGGKKLPKLGSSLGQAMKSFKQGVSDVEKGSKDIMGDIPGVQEATELKEKVDQVKNLGKVTKIFK